MVKFIFRIPVGRLLTIPCLLPFPNIFGSKDSSDTSRGTAVWESSDDSSLRVLAAEARLSAYRRARHLRKERCRSSSSSSGHLKLAHTFSRIAILHMCVRSRVTHEDRSRGELAVVPAGEARGRAGPEDGPPRRHDRPPQGRPRAPREVRQQIQVLSYSLS